MRDRDAFVGDRTVEDINGVTALRTEPKKKDNTQAITAITAVM